MINYNCKYIYKYYKKTGGKLTYRQFKDIIALNNQLIVDEIVKGYHFVIPHGIGVIRIIQEKRKISITEDNGTIKGQVNWGESLKLKARLLLEGKTLYECEKDKYGTILSDNGGERWLVYHIDNYFNKFIFARGGLLHNVWGYDFTPTWSNIKKLVAAPKEDAELMYKEANGTNRRNFIEKFTSKSRDYVQSEQ